MDSAEIEWRMWTKSIGALIVRPDRVQQGQSSDACKASRFFRVRVCSWRAFQALCGGGGMKIEGKKLRTDSTFATWQGSHSQKAWKFHWGLFWLGLMYLWSKQTYLRVVRQAWARIDASLWCERLVDNDLLNLQFPIELEAIAYHKPMLFFNLMAEKSLNEI